VKVFKFALDLESVPEAERKDTNPKELFKSFFFGAVQSSNAQGLDMQGQRSLNKILDKVDAAQGVSTVQLEDSEFEFLAKNFKAGKFRPQAYKFLNQIYDAIEEAEKKK
jgi:hypothetical protein